MLDHHSDVVDRHGTIIDRSYLAEIGPFRLLRQIDAVIAAGDQLRRRGDIDGSARNHVVNAVGTGMMKLHRKLRTMAVNRFGGGCRARDIAVIRKRHLIALDAAGRPRHPGRAHVDKGRAALGLRSEEHTSELQSLMRNSYDVFCLKRKTLINLSTG